jgi:hypothetical protein
MASVLRIETIFGQGVFSGAGDVLVERYPRLLEYAPANDPPLSAFMDAIQTAGSQYGLRAALRDTFRPQADPAYKRSQMQHWVFGFNDAAQLRAMFPEAAMFGVMRMNGMRLNAYDVDETNIYRARDQVLFFRPAAQKTARLDLLTL